MKKELLILVVLILFFIPTVSAVSINEVMPNPYDGCNDCTEWVELYSTNSIDLTNWTLDTQNQHFTFENIEIEDYLIITKNKTNFSILWPDVNFDKIIEWKGIGLTNSGDKVILNNSLNEIISNTSYSNFGSTNENKSWAFFNNEWQICSTPTPGSANSCPQTFFELYFPQYIIQNEIFAIMMNVSGYDNGLYDIKIDIEDENEDRISEIWDENDEEWQSTHYYVDEVLDINNEKGNYLAFLRINEDYTGPALIYSKIRKESTYTNPIIYLTEIVDFEQQEQGQQQEENSGSILEIVDYDENATFGDIIDVKLAIYRGDTSKYAVYIRVEQENTYDVSQETILHVLSKYVNYTIKVPVQLKMNCDEKYDNDTYFIVVEGLDEKTSEEIKISGKSSECPDNEYNELISEPVLLEQEQQSGEQDTMAITGQTIKTVESSSSTVLKITPYLIAILSLFIAFYIIKIK